MATNNGKYLFFISVNDMLGKEVLVVIVNFSRLMAEKMKEPILHVRGWVVGQITIVVAILYSYMIR